MTDGTQGDMARVAETPGGCLGGTPASPPADTPCAKARASSPDAARLDPRHRVDGIPVAPGHVGGGRWHRLGTGERSGKPHRLRAGAAALTVALFALAVSVVVALAAAAFALGRLP